MRQQDVLVASSAGPPAGFSPFSASSSGGGGGGSCTSGNLLLPPTPPRQLPAAHAAAALGRFGSIGSTTPSQDNFYGAAAALAGSGGLPQQQQQQQQFGLSRVGSGTGALGSFSSTAGNSPTAMQPAITMADLLGGGSSGGGSLAAAGRSFSSGLLQQDQQQQQQQQRGHQQAGSAGSGQYGWGGGSPAAEFDATAAAAASAYGGSPLLTRSSTLTAQQLLLHQHQQHQQQVAALTRSSSVDVGAMAAAHARAAAAAGGGQRQQYQNHQQQQHYGAGSAGGWGGRQHGGADDGLGSGGRVFGAVYDMKSLTAALSHVQSGTGDVRRMLGSCTFRPRLPGLTKLVSQMSREGAWAKALEVYESLDAVGVRPDTTITNAAISACDKGGQWERALQVFKSMSDLGLERDAITYSALISALSKGRQWALAIDAFNFMVAEGVECDAVTCCSLITAMDKGGQWQLAEQVFIRMYQGHTQFHVLLEGMTPEAPAGSEAAAASPAGSSLLTGAFSAAALNALSIQEDELPLAEELARQSSGFGGWAPGQQGEQAGDACASGGPVVASLSAQLAGIGLGKPAPEPPAAGRGTSRSSSPAPPSAQPSSASSAAFTSAFAAAAGSALSPSDTTAPQQQAVPAPAGASPSRPPMHPAKRAPGGPGAVPAASGHGLTGGAAPAVSSPPGSSSAAIPASPSGIQQANRLQRGTSGSLGNSSRAGSGAAAAAQQPSQPGAGLASPQASGQLSTAVLQSSPSGSFRLGRAGSLNSKKSSPNRVCCNALLAAYARAVPSRWRQSLRLLEVMWQAGGELVPDIVSYNTVMKACGNAQQTDIAFQLYQHMQQRGIEPTVATYGTLITIASEAQAYGRVKESWGWLQASGLPVHVTCANSYMTALIKEDNWYEAVQLFSQLKANQLGVRPNTVTYNIMMSACLNRDSPQDVKTLFDEMSANGLSPTLISFNTLLTALSKMGQWQESLALMHHLCSGSVVRPSSSSFNTVFGTLSNMAATVATDLDKQLLAQRARDLYQLMAEQQGVHPDSSLLRTIVATFAACNAPGMVLQATLFMVEQGHSLDPATASNALDALQQEGAWELTGLLLAGCSEAGAVVSPIVLQHLLLSCTQAGAWKAVRQVLQVISVSNQLEAVAQLLQHSRAQLQQQQQQQPPSAAGLLDADALDELLLLLFVTSQLATGGSWQQALSLFQAMRASRGPGFAARNGVLHGALLDLLVVRGGAAGLLNAIQLVTECHLSGRMAHYHLPPVNPTGSPLQFGAGGSPMAAAMSPAAASAGMLSPEQQLILQLEQAALSGSPQSTPAALGSQFAPALPGLPEPLSVVDVTGCSAIEGVVLVVSWLGQLVAYQARHGRLPGEVLRVATGGAGPAAPAELASLVLYRPAAGGDSKAAAGEAAAGSGDAGEAAGGGAGGGSTSALAEVPGSRVPVHAAVVALLSGQLVAMLGCGSAMEMLIPFSGAGQLGLGLLCCSPMPALLPEEQQGGGVLLPAAQLSAAIADALEASRT